MSKTENQLGARTQFICNHYGKIILVSTLLTIISIFFVKDLGLKTDIADLLPKSYQSVKTLDEIKAKVGGVGSLIVALEGAEYDKLTKAIAVLAGEIEKSNLVRNVEYQRDLQFVEDNKLMFAKHHQLETVKSTIEEKIADEKLKLSGLYMDLFEDDSEKSDKGFEQIRKKQEIFFTNDDKSIVAMKVYPSGTQSQLSFVRKLFAEVQEVIDRVNLDSISPGINVMYGGGYKSSIEENSTVLEDVRFNFLTTIPAIILFVTFYFFQPGGFAFIFLPLAMSICWTFGLTEIVYDDLNAITAFLFIILFGLGIDYGIHSFARYLEARRDGLDIANAIDKTVLKTGRGIFTSALTTSVAFSTLLLNDFKGFSQFGFICGFGVVNAYLAMTIVFPAFLTFFDKMKWIKIGGKKAPNVEKLGKAKYPAAKLILVIACLMSLAGGGVLIYSMVSENGIQFEYDFKQLRANIPKSLVTKRKVSTVFSDDITTPAIILSENRAMTREITDHFNDKIDREAPIVNLRKALYDHAKKLEDFYNSDNPSTGQVKRQARAIDNFVTNDSLLAALAPADLLTEVRSFNLYNELKTGNSAAVDKARLAALQTLLTDIASAIPEPTVKFLLTLETVVPDSQEQKLAIMQELQRLVNSDEADLIKGKDGEDLNELRRLLGLRKKITLDEMPDEMLKPFISKDGSLGEFVFIVPRVKLRDGRQAIRFSNDVQEINLPSNKKVFSSSPNIVIADILQVLLRESKLAVGLALFSVFVLVWIDVRELKGALLILTPLIASLLWLFAVMFLFSIKLNFFNMVVLPSIVGIGIDNGVHIYHRYREEGPGSIVSVMKTTGMPVTASVMTTMLGFIGLVFAQHQGLNSIGELAVLGLSLTLLAGVTLLPVLLQQLEK